MSSEDFAHSAVAAGEGNTESEVGVAVSERDAADRFAQMAERLMIEQRMIGGRPRMTTTFPDLRPWNGKMASSQCRCSPGHATASLGSNSEAETECILGLIFEVSNDALLWRRYLTT